MTRPAYTVVWELELTADFVQRWGRSDSTRRDFLTHLSHVIDTTLASAPESVGRPWREAWLWAPAGLTLIVGVVYEILAEDRIVKISQIMLVESEAETSGQ